MPMMVLLSWIIKKTLCINHVPGSLRRGTSHITQFKSLCNPLDSWSVTKLACIIGVRPYAVGMLAGI
jgi:hypothetical protein